MTTLANIKHLLIDMDGVLWRGYEPLPGLQAFFDTMRARQMGFMLLTNNATRTRQEYVDKLDQLGPGIEPQQILTSAYATADWLRDKVSPGATVYVVGEEGLRIALRDAGYNVVNGDAPEAADVVAVGLHLSFDYLTLHHASRLVRQGALYVGTNPDVTFPLPDGLGPGAGSLLAAITASANTAPTVIGKPGPLMYKQALKRLGAKAEETAMLGDRLETDILGGQRAGLATILVFSGVTTPEMLEASDIEPTWVFDDIAALSEALNSEE